MTLYPEQMRECDSTYQILTVTENFKADYISLFSCTWIPR